MSGFTLDCVSQDPVIILYNDLIVQTQSDLSVPIYSEIYLRFALNEYFESNTQDSTDIHNILQVYRKLLVLHYTQLYPSIEDLHKIMSRIFSYTDLITIINDWSEVLLEWKKCLMKAKSSV